MERQFPRPTFDQESNIHVLAAALDEFFRDLCRQPAGTWVETLKESMLVPFVTRPDPPKACLFGERNPRASSILHEERPQNWLAWFMPFLTHEDGKHDLLRAPTAETNKTESIWSIGLLLTTSVLHWAFANCSAELFHSMIMDIRNKFEPLGWDELNSARVRRIFSAFIAKINNSRAYIAKTDVQQLKFLENMTALCNGVEDFVFYSPLYGFNTKPDSGVCGLHFDGTGILDADLLRGLLDCIQTHAHGEMKTVMQGLDKKDAKEYKKRALVLEDTKVFLQLTINWTTAAGNFLSQTSQRAWVPGRADGLHVGLGDRVLIKQNKQGDLLATVAYKAPGQLGVVFDGPMGGSNGTFGGKQLFCCADGHGALVKPEHAFALEDTAGKQEYDKLAAIVTEALVKRSYFKGNKKQIREAFDEVKTDKRNYGERTRRLRESTTFSASLADVPFETCLEQTKAGAYSLRRTIRYLTKLQEAKLNFLGIMDKINQEEGMKQMADQMESFTQTQKCMVHFEFAKSSRERQILAEIQQEVIVPFQTLEKEYDTAVGHFKLQHNITEKAIEANQTSLAKDLAECEKELQELRKIKQEMDTGKRPQDAKFAKQIQQTASKIAQYENASARFKEETYASLRRNQRQLRAELQTVEQRRLVFTQVYLQRYLSACETLTGAFPHIPHFAEKVAELSPAADLALFVAIHRRPDIEYFIQRTSCTSADVLQGNLAASAMSSVPVDTAAASLIRGVSLLDDSSRSPQRRRLVLEPEAGFIETTEFTPTLVETGDDPLVEDTAELPVSPRNGTLGSPIRRQSHDLGVPVSPSSPKGDKAKSVMGLASAMKHKSNASLTSVPCAECRCLKFTPSLLKKSRCSNCNHVHISVTSPKLEA